MAIHPTAIVDRHAELDSSVEVGPYAVIGPKVKIGARTRVGPHAVIEGDTTIGQENVIFQFAAVGAIPQDLKYAGEQTRLVIGNANRIREFATLHIGTAAATSSWLASLRTSSNFDRPQGSCRNSARWAQKISRT